MAHELLLVSFEMRLRFFIALMLASLVSLDARAAEEIFQTYSPLTLESFRASAGQSYANPFAEEYVRQRWTGRDIVLQITVPKLDESLQQYFQHHLNTFQKEVTPPTSLVRNIRVQMTAIKLVDLNSTVPNGVNLRGTVKGFIDSKFGYFPYTATVTWVGQLVLAPAPANQVGNLMIDTVDIDKPDILFGDMRPPQVIADLVGHLIASIVPTFEISLKDQFDEINKFINPLLGTSLQSPALSTAPDGYPAPFVMIGANVFSGPSLSVDDTQFQKFRGSHIPPGKDVSLVVDPTILPNTLEKVPGVIGQHGLLEISAFKFNDVDPAYSEHFSLPVNQAAAASFHPTLYLSFPYDTSPADPGFSDLCQNPCWDFIPYYTGFGSGPAICVATGYWCGSETSLHQNAPINYVAPEGAPAAGSGVSNPPPANGLSLGTPHASSDRPVPTRYFEGNGSIAGIDFDFTGSMTEKLMQKDGVFKIAFVPHLDALNPDLPWYAEWANALFDIVGPNIIDGVTRIVTEAINNRFIDGAPMQADFSYDTLRVTFDQMQFAHYYQDSYGNTTMDTALSSWNLQGPFPTFQQLGHNFVLMGNYVFTDDIKDSDGDGISDMMETKLFRTDPNRADTDGDGLDDFTEITFGSNPLVADTDGDGLNDLQEFVQYSNPHEADNRVQAILLVINDLLLADDDLPQKTDKDKIPDGDNDGIPDQRDNCPGMANADQMDTDADGIGDACDSDDDNDGLSDEEELQLGTDPKVEDSDQDGLTDWQEVRVYHTNPLNPDSDGDGISDGDEIRDGRNPNMNEAIVLLPVLSLLMDEAETISEPPTSLPAPSESQTADASVGSSADVVPIPSSPVATTAQTQTAQVPLLPSSEENPPVAHSESGPLDQDSSSENLRPPVGGCSLIPR